MGVLREDLLGPDVELEETHISWVFLHPDDVYKVKKPVDLGFLDFSTLEKRKEACEAEMRLNRRLAPDVYLGVVPITRDRDGRHHLGGEGETVDWAVHMRRLPLDRRADTLLEKGRLEAEDLERVARHLTAFHEEAREDEETAQYGTVEAVRFNVLENFQQTENTLCDHLSPEEGREIQRWQTELLDREEERFDQRIRSGKVRDGHGDLRLEHVYLEDDRVVVIDCIEFNERFRFADVAADVAFLSMDLSWHGRVDLAERFLAAYARFAGDYDLYPLIDFYESYRAYVRGKVSSFLSCDEEADRAIRQKAAAEARRYYLLALASERRSLLPSSVVAVGGLLASGKSTLTDRIGQAMAAPVVDSDRTRKQMLGVEETEKVHHPPFEGAYSPERTENVYAELLRRGQAVLDSGRPVVLDASFRSRDHRARARRLATEHGVPFFFVECRAPVEILRARLRQREKETGVSDGRLEIFDDFVESWEEVDELPSEEHLVVETDRPLAESLAKLERDLPTWPAGLTW